LSRTIDRLARRVRNSGVQDAYRHTHGRLLEIARTSTEQTRRLVGMLSKAPPASHGKTETLRRDLEHFSGLLSQVVSQTERRVFDGESVPAAEKLVSI
jgi:hypothetical protein